MKAQVTQGKLAVGAPRMRPRAEDLPAHILDEKVWLNKVCTFGVASAGYWWGRAGACCCRLSHYLLGYRFMLWLLLYGDDEWLVGRGQHYHMSLLLHMLVLDIIGTPISWHKVGGGIQTDWVGYYLDFPASRSAYPKPERLGPCNGWRPKRVSGRRALGRSARALAGCSSWRDLWSTSAHF